MHAYWYMYASGTTITRENDSELHLVRSLPFDVAGLVESAGR